MLTSLTWRLKKSTQTTTLTSLAEKMAMASPALHAPAMTALPDEPLRASRVQEFSQLFIRHLRLISRDPLVIIVTVLASTMDSFWIGARA